jgi:undecaprenyl-diphosphatase
MDDLIVFAAQSLILLPVLVIIFILIKLNGPSRTRFLLLLLACGFLSYGFAQIISHIYNNPRPYINDGIVPLFPHSTDPNGFPSDHTLLASFLGFIALSYSKKIGLLLLIIAAIIGWARVAAGVHHLVDVIGAFACSGIAYLIVSSFMKKKSFQKLK